MMTLAQKILAIYPELDPNSCFMDGCILLQDDSDGNGVYIKSWTYSKPRPTQEQLNSYD